jgi:transcriptional regulator with XRE-family HTH domain
MNIFSRIIEYIDFKGISKNEFSVKIGLSNSYMTKMEKSKGNVGSQVIEKIVRVYPDLNLYWLITGEGSMLKQDNTQLAPDQSDLPPGPCRQCELRERLLAAQEERIAELREHLHDTRHQDHPKSKQRSA